MKNTQQYTSFSRPLFYFTFALAVVAWILSIVLIVMEGIFGLVGFNNTAQISSTCNLLTETYYYIKYNNNNSTILSLCFVFTLIAVICSTVLIVILLVLLVKLIKEDVVAFRKSVKVSIYVCCSLLILAATIPAGYYLAYTKELAQCAVTSYNASQVQAVAIIAIIIVALAFFMWLLFILYFYQTVSSQEKYREVTTNQTEIQQKAQANKYEEEQPKKRNEPVYNTTHQKEQARKEVYRLEETQQNLNQSPSKRKMNTYGRQLIQERNQPIRNNSVPESRNGLVSQQKKHVPQRLYNREADNDQGQLVLMRERKYPTASRDQQEYKQYQLQYRSRNQGGRSILPSNGVLQRDYKNSDYYRSGGSPPQRISPSRNQKQGVLIKHIRRKYAG